MYRPIVGLSHPKLIGKEGVQDKPEGQAIKIGVEGAFDFLINAVYTLVQEVKRLGIRMDNLELDVGKMDICIEKC